MNYKQPGEKLTLVAPYDREAGEGAVVGSVFGVALNDVDSGDETTFGTEGVYELSKTSAQAWTQGQKIHWNTSTKKCDSDPTVGPLIGFATKAAANPTSTGLVKLNGTAQSMSEGAQAAIADIATADGDATYGSPEATLLNELKAKVNTLLAELRIQGILAP